MIILFILLLCLFPIVGLIYGMITGKNIINGKSYWRSNKKENLNNPYIDYHKSKMKNDKDYDEYLKWLDKNGNGVPVEKQLTLEDKKAENKIKKLF